VTTVAGAPVVVGVDSSPGALAAVRVAAREAHLRHRGLRVVHAFTWPVAGWATTPGWAVLPPDACREDAAISVAEAANVARRVAPGIEITGEVVDGSPGPVLLAESRHAVLVVVGNRGRGGFPGMLIGSVAGPVAAHAASPVLVIRGHRHPDGPVVVGIDGSPTSVLALDFAAEEAVLRDTELVALHAWSGGDGTELNADLPMTHEFWAGDEEQQRVLAEALAGLAGRHPDLRVRRQVRRGSARRLLRDWSQTSQLVVVGDRGHGGFAGLLLGSVSHHLLMRAGCPTAVVRPALVEAGVGT
jgi:nucleotide-binding universal stress UspA family protein